MCRYCLLLLLCFFAIAHADAQVVSIYPYFPDQSDSVTIIFDATQGNAALAGTSTVYAHTGVITTQSTSTSDWKNVQGNWGTADNHMLMTSLGNNKFKLSYKINSFYNLTSGDTVKDLAFVFRNVDGSVVGRNADGSDILIKIYDSTLHAAFANSAVQLLTLNSTVDLFGTASRICNLSIHEGANTLVSSHSDSLSLHGYQLTHYGAYDFVLQAIDGVDTVTDTKTVIVNPAIPVQDPPTNVVDGINYMDDSTVVFVLTAPFKSYIYVIGDFNNWQVDTNYLMKKSVDGTRWWLRVSHLTPQKEYIFQYLVDGSIRIGDPYSDKISDPNDDRNIAVNVYPNLIQYPTGKTHDIAGVIQTAQTPYNWQVTNFQKPDKQKMVVYELLVRDFVTYHNWSRVIDTLGYLERLGINTIELMPIMNFEGNSGWGYNPNYFCAPDKAYGPKDSLKRFIDVCHSKGIAVVLDIAFNDAFSTCPLVKMYWDDVNEQPAANNPWFNQQATHPYSVGYDFNHESAYTKKFLDKVTRHWLGEYHADGFRFDLTKGYTQHNTGTDVGAWGQYDASRVAILKRMVDSIWAFDPTAICIFEQLSENQEQTELSNHGVLLWGNMSNEYNQASMGYQASSDISQTSYQARGWTNPNLVAYMESHDEERQMYKNIQYGNVNGLYSTKDVRTALKRMEMTGTLFFPIPGPKMFYQFEELGYDLSINFGCRICAKPLLWYYAADTNRLHLYKVWAALIALKKNYAPFSTTDYSMNAAGMVKTIKLNHADFNVLVAGNIDVSTQSNAPVFQHTGWWYDYFTGDSLDVRTNTQIINFQPGEYRLYTDKYIGKADLDVSTPDTTVGIEQTVTVNQNITVYPNPTEGLVNFVFNLSAPSEVAMEIFDINGRQIYSQKQSLYAGSQNLTVNMGSANGIGASTGMYFYRIAINGQPVNGKIQYINN